PIYVGDFSNWSQMLQRSNYTYTRIVFQPLISRSDSLCRHTIPATVSAVVCSSTLWPDRARLFGSVYYLCKREDEPTQMKVRLAQVLLLVALVAGCGQPVNEEWRKEAENPDFLHRTIRQVTNIIIHDIFSPPVASRIYRYTSVAAYEAAIQGNPNFKSLAGQLNGLEPTPAPEEGE